MNSPSHEFMDFRSADTRCIVSRSPRAYFEGRDISMRYYSYERFGVPVSFHRSSERARSNETLTREEAAMKRRREKAKLPNYIVSEASQYVEDVPRLLRPVAITSNSPALTVEEKSRPTFQEMRADLERANPKIKQRAARMQKQTAKSE
ncbi:UNVERIFIED_CONTAM: hypothetical protein Q9R58_09360 [Methylobacteriaceae bacterium AG10]|nr:hypothetical protein [Methylobacteriaceae bacterium AG10]